jgi:hypothetical protein
MSSIPLPTMQLQFLVPGIYTRNNYRVQNGRANHHAHGHEQWRK